MPFVSQVQVARRIWTNSVQSAFGAEFIRQTPYTRWKAAFFISGRNFAAFKPLGYVLILGAIAIFGNGIKFAINYTLKFLFTAFLSQVVFMTTSSLQMKSALEDAQNFIARIFPPIKKANPALIIFLAISFIPQIFQTWNKIKLAARARSCDKKKYRNFLRNIFLQFEALFSCLLFYAETKRKVLQNRSKKVAID